MASVATLLRTREALCTALSAVQGLHVSTHNGVFDLKELQRYSKQTPAAVLTLLGFDAVRPQAEIEINARWGLVLFCVDRPGVEKGAAVIGLAEQCMLVLQSTWARGESGGSRPVGMTARTIFGSTLDGTGCAMWQIEWSQRLLIDIDPDADGEPFKLLSVTWNIDHVDPPEAHDDIVLEGAV